VWIICSSAGVADLYVLNGVAITDTEAAYGLTNKTVVRSWLESVPNNQQIHVRSQVTLNGSVSPGDVITLPTTTYTLVNYPPLSIDQTAMNLNGRAITVPASWNWIRKGDYQGNHQTRVAIGGRPPYTYTSRNPAVASVASTGKVIGVANGSTVIDVRDSLNHSVGYVVNVSNVWQLRENQNSLNWGQAVDWRKSLAGAQGIYFDNGIRLMGDAYGWPIPVPADAHYWLCVEEGCDFLTGVYWGIADPNQVWCANRVRLRWAWCLQP
jgi:hypothetical protein